MQRMPWKIQHDFVSNLSSGCPFFADCVPRALATIVLQHMHLVRTRISSNALHDWSFVGCMVSGCQTRVSKCATNLCPGYECFIQSTVRDEQNLVSIRICRQFVGLVDPNYCFYRNDLSFQGVEQQGSYQRIFIPMDGGLAIRWILKAGP